MHRAKQIKRMWLIRRVNIEFSGGFTSHGAVAAIRFIICVVQFGCVVNTDGGYINPPHDHHRSIQFWQGKILNRWMLSKRLIFTFNCHRHTIFIKIFTQKLKSFKPKATTAVILTFWLELLTTFFRWIILRMIVTCNLCYNRLSPSYSLICSTVRYDWVELHIFEAIIAWESTSKIVSLVVTTQSVSRTNGKRLSDRFHLFLLWLL